MHTTFNATSTAVLACNNDSAMNEQEPIDFDEALSELTLNVQIGYRICSLLDLKIARKFDWYALSGAEIFEIAIGNDSLARLIDEGFSSGLAKEDLVKGIDSAASIWASAQDFAGSLFQEMSPEHSAQMSELEVDCRISACADDDSELHDIRMSDPLLYSAICIELSRAVENP